MKVKTVAIICLLIFTSFLTLHAQWAKTYGGSEDDYPSSILQTSDGGYIVAGTTKSFGTDFTSIWILKFNTRGDIEWQKTYGDSGAKYGNSIQQTNDGGYIVATVYSVLGGPQFGIIKLAPDGNIEWLKIFGDDLLNYTYSIQQTIDGGYIAAGYEWSTDPIMFNIVIFKISTDGTEEWSKTYGGSGDDRAYSILQTDEGGFIAAGYTTSYGAGDNDIWVLKLASDGSIEWQKTYGGGENEIAYSILQTNDRGYIIAGSISSFGAGLTDFWVLKLSSEGGIEWNKIYGGSEIEVAHSICQTFDGGYIVAGETESFGAGNKDIWILKLSILGNIEWQKTYGGSQDEEASSIQQTNGGGYIVAGSTFSYGAGERDLFVLKLFSNGDINSSCGLVNESNAEVSDTDISPEGSNSNPGDPDLRPADLHPVPGVSEAVVYSLCSGVQHTLSISTSSGGTTIPQPGTYIYDHAERISLGVNPEGGYNFIGWSGDVSSTERPLYITMDSDKSIKANFIENVIDDLIEEVKKAPCFIATAAFGSPVHPYVKTLQDFRDKYLMSSRTGRKLVSLYYKYSPHIAELITNHKALRSVVRIWLVPFVAVGYSMVHFGPVKTTFMFALTLMPLLFFVWFYRRRNKLLDY